MTLGTPGTGRRRGNVNFPRIREKGKEKGWGSSPEKARLTFGNSWHPVRQGPSAPVLGAERTEPLSRAPCPDCSLFWESPPGPRRELRLPLRLHPHHVLSRLGEIRSHTASQSRVLTPCSSPCFWRGAPVPKGLQPAPPTSAGRGPLSRLPGGRPRPGTGERRGGPSCAGFLEPLTCGGPALRGPAADKTSAPAGSGRRRTPRGLARGGGNAASHSRLAPRAPRRLAHLRTQPLSSHDLTGAPDTSATSGRRKFAAEAARRGLGRGAELK